MPAHRVNGIRLVYTDQGSGLTLLLVHGFPLNRSIWEPQIGVLSQLFRVLAPDLRGHGESDASEGIYSMACLADDLRALLDELQLEKVVLCGLSMGGYVVLAFYDAYPDRVQALVLVNTKAEADSENRRAARLDLIHQIESEGLQPLLDQQLPTLFSPRIWSAQTEMIAQVQNIILSVSLNGAIGTLKGMAARSSRIEMLSQVKVPTLILAGKDDKGISPHESQKMNSLILSSKLVILEGTGHLMNLEQPETFNNVLISFLREAL